MNWRERKPRWVIVRGDGVLLGVNGATSLYDTRKEARSVLMAHRHIGLYIDARIAKVEVLYREASRRDDG